MVNTTKIEYGDEAFEAQPVLSTDPLERDLDVEEFSSNHRLVCDGL